ncbi:MAG: type II secretory pathway, component PulD [Opitutaceae bacterium]|nr:type II secretory pathway, component PulD [Opitutaceae bacterium]
MKFLPSTRGLGRLFLPWLIAAVAAPLPAQERPAPAPAPAGAVAREPQPDDPIGFINLPGDSIDSVIVLLERLTGKAVLRPQNLPAVTVTLNLKDAVSRQEAIQAIETLLNLNGIAVTPLGTRFLKVTPLNAAKSEAPEFIEGSTLGLPPSGRTASKLFQLEFLRVGEFMPQIAGLLNPAAGAPPVVFDKSNAALITDSVSNLQRIETLVAKLDQPLLAGLQPKFYSLQSAKASDVVNKMRAILTGPLQTQLGSATTYSPDDRTNQIILIADPRQHPFFDELVAKLDVRSDPNTRNEVIFLKHAAAKDVATILTQLVTGQNNAARAQGAEANRAMPTTAPAPATPAAASPPPATPNAAALGLTLEPSNQFSPLLTILPEDRSNSIVVSGTVDDIRLINELVAKIDVLLAQVRIEVVIAEVTLTDNATSGIGALDLKVEADKLVGFAGTGAGTKVSDAAFSRPAEGQLDLAATISLSTTPRKSNATILSQPNIITTHNKEGKIFVGEQRPVISSYLNDGTTTNTGIGTGYRSNVSSKDIGIDLSVKPLIGTDGSVQLEIKQEVNDVLGEITIDGNPQPRIGRRTTESFVSVRSGDIIVLGGLQRTSQSKSSSRLGPIPIIGDLLGTRSREGTRTDLVFFLRPTVLTNTAADNAPALRQIEKLPAKERSRIEEAIGVAPAPAAAK